MSVALPPKFFVCDCGAEKAGSPKHADYCSTHKRPKGAVELSNDGGLMFPNLTDAELDEMLKDLFDTSQQHKP